MVTVHFENIDSSAYQDLYLECVRLEWCPRITRYSTLRQGDVDVNSENVFIGSYSYVNLALRKGGKIPPPENIYPVYLNKFYHRNIWKSNIAVALSVYPEIFAIREFFFSGVVTKNSECPVDAKQPVWCSEVVKWNDPFQIFVDSNQVIMGGNKFKVTHKHIRFVRNLVNSLPSPLGIIDCGTIGSSLAVIRFRDPLYFREYKLPLDIYLNMVVSRWKQIFS